jgi:N-acyl homoserine lactone hydrolase
MNNSASITVTPVRVADLLAEGERMPVYVHVIDHPDGRVLVDTGMTELHPAVADMDPRLRPLSKQGFDLASIDIVVNTHLHFDHCGGNHLFAGKPIYVQRRELQDARSEDDYISNGRIVAGGDYESCGDVTADTELGTKAGGSLPGQRVNCCFENGDLLGQVQPPSSR